MDSKKRAEVPNPVIEIGARGFCVVEAGKVTFHIEWADVQEVVAFKEDLFGYDEICVGFRIDRTENYRRVTEDFAHYKDLLDELPHHFTGIRTDWFTHVAFPAFVPNWTTIWGESLSSLPPGSA